MNEPKDIFNYVYGDKLGCKIDSLLLLTSDIADKEIQKKFFLQTLFMLVGTGLSAGSICWFKYGHSDSNSFRNSEGHWDYIRANGLGLINAIHCPHYNEEGREGFDDMMKSQNIVGIALENNCALVVRNNKFRIIKSDEDAKVYKITNKYNIVNKEIIDNYDFKDIDDLLMI